MINPSIVRFERLKLYNAMREADEIRNNNPDDPLQAEEYYFYYLGLHYENCLFTRGIQQKLEEIRHL